MDELLLQSHARAAHFGKARGVANHATCAARCQLAHDVHRGLTRHGDKAGVRRLGQRGHAGVAGDAFDRGACGVHRPQVTGKPELAALANGFGGSIAAKHRNMAWREQALQLRATGAVLIGVF